MKRSGSGRSVRERVEVEREVARQARNQMFVGMHPGRN